MIVKSIFMIFHVDVYTYKVIQLETCINRSVEGCNSSDQVAGGKHADET